MTRSWDDTTGRADGIALGTSSDVDIDHSVSYDFDSAGRYDEVAGAGKTFNYTYSTASYGLIATIAGPANILITNTWDDDRDVLVTKLNEVDSTPVSEFTYGVNNLGQRESVETDGDAFGGSDRGWSWGYDALGQLTNAANAADTDFNRLYDFDDIGNRTSATDGSGGTATTTDYTPNKLNQYTTIDPEPGADPPVAVSPVYDADANLLEDAGINGMTYGLKFDWDGENRIIAVKKADDTLLATYDYDYLGRRIRKTTTSSATQGTSDTAYVFDGWNVVAEYSVTSLTTISLTQAYTWGLDLSGSMQGAGGVGGLLCIHRTPGIDGNGNRIWTDAFYPTYDGNGNVCEYLDASGDEEAHFEYDPFGRAVSSSGAPGTFPYRFSTKPQDFETGLYYYGYRHYDPVTGRWPSRDPLGENWDTEEYNEYCYIGNSTIDWIDLLGLKKKRGGKGGGMNSGSGIGKSKKRGWKHRKKAMSKEEIEAERKRAHERGKALQKEIDKLKEELKNPTDPQSSAGKALTEGIGDMLDGFSDVSTGAALGGVYVATYRYSRGKAIRQCDDAYASAYAFGEQKENCPACCVFSISEYMNSEGDAWFALNYTSFHPNTHCDDLATKMEGQHVIRKWDLTEVGVEEFYIDY